MHEVHRQLASASTTMRDTTWAVHLFQLCGWHTYTAQECLICDPPCSRVDFRSPSFLPRGGIPPVTKPVFPRLRTQGCGVFLAGEDLGGRFDESFPPFPLFSPLSFSFFFFFFFCFVFCFKVEISLRTPIPLFRKNQSTVVQRAETTGRAFPDELRASSFPWSSSSSIP